MIGAVSWPARARPTLAILPVWYEPFSPPRATFTPDEVREQLGLHPGDEVELRVLGPGVAGGRRSASSLAGLLRSEARGVTLADMERAIGDGATGR